MALSLVGIGLGRFAYTPLIPAVIAAGWFAPAQAAWLGAVNLAAYLGGAVAAIALARRVGVRAVLRGAMPATALSFLVCALPAPFTWFALWRFVSSASGARLMILAAPPVLPFVPPPRRGLAAGMIFAGIWLGVTISALLVPLMLRVDLGAAWLALGRGVAGTHRRRLERVPRRRSATCAAAARAGCGRADPDSHVRSDCGRLGLAVGAACWGAFGLDALLGPAVAGFFADRLGFARATRAGLLLQAAAVAAPLWSESQAALLLSAAVIGAFTPGAAPLMLGRIHTVLAPGSETARAAWGRATIAWAPGQAIGGQTFSVLFGRGERYEPLFLVATGVLLSALLFDVMASGKAVPSAD